MGLVLAMVFVVSAGGCASKTSKCQKGWAQLADMGKTVSGIVGMVGKAFGKTIDLESKIREVEPKFMEACMQLSEDAMDCIADVKNKMLDPKCILTIAKLPRL